MEIRDFARRVVESESLAVKLKPAPAELTDRRPGPPLRIPWPERPPELAVAGSPVRTPSVLGLADPAQRPRILHGLANHELQAAELFAWALLAFPEAPPEFRRGLLAILGDEQRHTRMYIARLEAHGARFGEQPVSGYFWSKVENLHSPLDFICAMSLTFENANLDHAPEAAEAAVKGGDLKTAAVLDAVHRDEIEHVRFGWRWLQVFKGEEESSWDAYRRSLTWPLRPGKARAGRFHREGREAAGLDEEFIRRLEESRV
jgi:uncharacterized ferritin-like protein (DUF455 family)